MNFAAPMHYGVVGGASLIATADPFDESPLNPMNMSRTPERHTHGTAPSSKLLERVRLAASDLAQLATTQAGWRFLSEKNNTTLYEMNGAALPANISVASTFGGAGGKASDYYLAKAVTTINIDVDHLLTLLATDTTEQFALRMNQIFSKHYQNGVVVDQLSCTTPPASFQSQDGSMKTFTDDDAYAVNWLSLKAASSSDGARDFTLASYQDSFQRDPRGQLVRLGRSAAKDPPRRGDGTDRLMGVHVMTSFNFKDIPELPKSKNTSRFHLRNTGFVVEETNEHGVYRLTFFMALMPVAVTLKSPKKFEKWVQSLALCVNNLALHAKPTNVINHNKKMTWAKSNHCMMCLKGFHAFRRCHHCRFCGEAVCNKCSGFVDVSRFDVVQTLHGKIRPAATPAMSDHYAETRGCTSCIKTMMDDVNNTNLITATTSMDDRRSSTTGSNHSNDNLYSKSSVASYHSNVPILAGEHDDHASDDGNGNEYRSANNNSLLMAQQQQHQRQGRPTSTNDTNSLMSRPDGTRQRSDGVMAIDDLDDLDDYYEQPPPPSSGKIMARHPHPHAHPQALDPKSSLSMSTTSTSFSHQSYEDQNLRVSAASQEYGNQNQNQSQHRFPPSRPPSYQDQQPAMYQNQNGNGNQIQNQNGYVTRDVDVMASSFSGFSIHNLRAMAPPPPAPLQQQPLYDDEVDIDGPSYALSRSMLSVNKDAPPSAAATNQIHRPPRPTIAHSTTSNGSGGSGSGSNFKYSMMSATSIHSEPEAEPQHDTFTGHYGKPSDHARMTRPNRFSNNSHSSSGEFGGGSSSNKLLSVSMGGAPQRFQPPPRHHNHPAAYHSHPPKPRSSSSASASSRSSEASLDMIPLPMKSTMTAMASMTEMAPPPPAASVVSSASGNDMILLAPPAPKSPQFVVFSSSRRQSVFVRPDNGSDMIPLNF